MNDRDYTTMKKAELLSTVEELRDHLDRLENQDAVYDLTLSEARYRALFEGSSDFIYVLDSGGYFTFANAESGHLLGYDPEEIIGKHFSDILHPDDVDAVGRAFHERRTGERAARRVEVRMRSRGGDMREVEMDVRHFAISASGLYRGGDFIGTHGVARDITERKYQETKRVVPAEGARSRVGDGERGGDQPGTGGYQTSPGDDGGRLPALRRQRHRHGRTADASLAMTHTAPPVSPSAASGCSATRRAMPARWRNSGAPRFPPIGATCTGTTRMRRGSASWRSTAR